MTAAICCAPSSLCSATPCSGESGPGHESVPRVAGALSSVRASTARGSASAQIVCDSVTCFYLLLKQPWSRSSCPSASLASCSLVMLCSAKCWMLWTSQRRAQLFRVLLFAVLCVSVFSGDWPASARIYLGPLRDGLWAGEPARAPYGACEASERD
jgi:hypothetical protein